MSYETLKPKVDKFEYDNWVVTTFPIAHNVSNFGVILKHKVTDNSLCYMTDFNKAPLVEKCDTFLYEVNYIENIIDEMIEDNKDIKNCGFNNHNSLENAVEYFSTLKTRPKTIICCHLSNSNAIADRILKAMNKYADNVYIAKKGAVYGNRQ